ncbi:putative MFS sugar transporter-like protein [Seiridium unicorne]|uniref:MFS sugar transporter-like protein n=1 Tax=Seiridium unicorne TaxID=138068 RepID=A0ABR2UN48_9PEZI
MAQKIENDLDRTAETTQPNGVITRYPPSIAGNDDENSTVWKTVKNNPLILLCCFYANLGAFMYGFDNITLSLCLDMAPFVMKFGDLVDGQYVVAAYWQSLWNAIPQLMTGVGAWTSGPIADRLGRRWTMFIAGIFSVVGVAIVYTAESNGQFLGGKMVNAIGLGMALASGQTYISEITPLKVRGIALALYTFCLSVGYLIAASISFTRVTIMDDSAYKVLFAAEWCWPAAIMAGAFLVPESPYFLIRKNRIEAANKSLSRLHHRNERSVQATLLSIQGVIQHESESGHSTFIECFKGTNWRRTRIVLYANGLSQMTGAVFLNNAPYFMVLAGLSATNVAMIVEVGIALSIISSIFTFWGMTFLGRRALVLGGTAFAGVLFFIMGICAALPNQNGGTRWAVAITLQMAWLSIGPANGPALAVAGEVSTMRLRAKTLAIGFFFNYFYSTVWNVVVPYMFNPGYGNLGGELGWVFFGTCLISLAILWFELPDTKDLTAAQIDERFEIRVRTRGFRNKDYQESQTSGKDIEMDQVEQVSDRDTVSQPT